MRSKVLKKATGYLLTAVMVMMLCVNFFGIQVSAASDGFKVSGTKLYDANGNEFIMRGVNYPHAWYTSEYKTAIPAIADKGFNCVRLVMANGQKWGKTSYSEMSEMIELCKQNKLVAIVEIHDATGSDSTSDLNKAVDYWIEMKNLLQGNEKYVIVNIANEWYGTWDNGSAWKSGNISAVQKMRNAGIKNTVKAAKKRPSVRDAGEIPIAKQLSSKWVRFCLWWAKICERGSVKSNMGAR